MVLPSFINVQQELSETLAGRQKLFDRFTAADERFQNLNPIVRRGRGRQFNPLSAAFSLQQLQNPQDIAGGNFADFLGSSPNRLNREGFNQSFQSLAASLFGGDQGLPQGEQGVAREFIQEQETTAENIIQQFATSGITPLLRGAARRGAQSGIDAFRARDTGTGLFEQFLRGGIGGLGGGFIQ